MSASLCRRLGAATAAAFVVVVLGTAPGAASAGSGVAPDKQGWWAAAGGSAGAPDAPPDGLFVEGSAADPLAVSALRYRIPAGATVDTLVLSVAPNSVTVAGTSVRACPLTGNRDFAAAQGGPMADAPTWDCAGAAPGTPDASGSAYSFAVGQLGAAGILAVAIVPAGQRDRIAFARPQASSLPVTYPAVSESPPTDAAALPAVLDLFTPPASLDLAPFEAPREAPVPADARVTATTPSALRPQSFDERPATKPGGGPASALAGAVIVAAAAAATARRGRRALTELLSGANGAGS